MFRTCSSLITCSPWFIANLSLYFCDKSISCFKSVVFWFVEITVSFLLHDTVVNKVNPVANKEEINNNLFFFIFYLTP